MNIGKSIATSVIWLVAGGLSAMSIWHDRSIWFMFWALVLACVGTAILFDRVEARKDES